MSPEMLKYEGCSESNSSYFKMLAHSVGGRCWWYGSRGWTFLPVFYQILLLCDRWQQRGSLTKWHLAWKFAWSIHIELNSSMRKIWHPLTFVVHWACDHSEVVMMWFSSGNSVCEHSEMVGVADFYEWHAVFCSPQVKMHSWWIWLHRKTVFCSWEFVLSNSIICSFYLL